MSGLTDLVARAGSLRSLTVFTNQCRSRSPKPDYQSLRTLSDDVVHDITALLPQHL